MRRYNPTEIESKWQKIWDEQKTFEVEIDKSKPKSYVTAMFPYPSGAGLHVGHVRNYSITDVIARYERAQGKNVLSTIGWDAFGLPAENFAIKTGVPPAKNTKENIISFKNQLKRLGVSYDWSRELNTTDPSYYKWTQWLFLKFFEKGLAYQKESLQWWCPKCKTVLANEQVINGGYCWRHEDTAVEKKWLKQWFLKITDYADELLDGIDDLAWPEKIKSMQRNWIGRSKGAEVDFATDQGDIKVFTTRPDTLFGATFMVLAPEHAMVEKLTTKTQASEVEAYVNEAVKKSDIDRMNETREKTGVFTGSYATNPVNGEKIPVWIADYVLTGYGTGAIMAVPAHDERDYEFAKSFNLPIRQVVAWAEDDNFNPPKPGLEMVERSTVVVHLQDKSTGKFALLNWHGSLEGITTAIMGGIEEGQTPEEAAIMEIKEEAALDGVKINGKLRWISISQYCASHKNQNRRAIAYGLLAEVENLESQGERPEEEKELHTLVWVDKDKVAESLTPDHQKLIWEQLLHEEVFTGEGEIINSGEYNGMASSEAREKIVADLTKKTVAEEKVNYRMRDWLISRQRYWGAPIPIIHCEKDGAVAVPEDQLPVELPEVDDYEPKGDGKGVLAHVPEWYNVKCPKCGGDAVRETDTMDGYVCSSWYLFRYTDANNGKQAWDPEKANYWAPVDFYCGGDHAVAHLLYVRFWTKFLRDEGLLDFDEPVKQLVYNGYINAHDGLKMSKSKGNVVDPLELIDQGYGADALRLYELFIGPYEQDASWDPKGIAGTYRFINRAWTLVQEYSSAEFSEGDSTDTVRSTHKAIKKVSEDLARHSFNTAVAALMEFVNELYKQKANGFSDKGAWQFALSSLTQLIQPFAPHVAEELWQQLGHEDGIISAGWPSWDKTYLVTDTITIAVQVNGKLRGQVEVAADLGKDEIIDAAKNHENIKTHLNGEPKKSIYIPGRLVNFVT